MSFVVLRHITGKSNLMKVDRLVLAFFLYFADRPSEYIYLLISTNLMQ